MGGRASVVVGLLASGLATALVAPGCKGEDPVLSVDDASVGGDAGGTEASIAEGGDTDVRDAEVTTKPGDIDRSFANGPIRGPSGQPVPLKKAHAVAIDAKGRTYLAGAADACVIATPNPGSFLDFAVVRLAPNGQVDTTYGTGGVACVDVGPKYDDDATAIAIDPFTGTALVAGTSADPFAAVGDDGPRAAVVRLTETGAVHPAFNGGQPYRVASNLNVLARPAGIAIVPGSTAFYVGGFSALPLDGSNGAWILSFRETGVLDPTFNTTGRLSFGSGLPALAIAADPRGDVYAAGGSIRFVSWRYTAAGAEVAPWGTGPVAVDPGGESQGRAAVLSGDRLYVATTVNRAASATIAPAAVVKHQLDAKVDTTFASTSSKPGVFLTDAVKWDIENQFSGLAVQADGKILLAGLFDADTATGSDLAVMRLMPDGSRDTGFGDNGIARTRLPGPERMIGMALDMPRKQVVVLGLDATLTPVVYRFLL